MTDTSSIVTGLDPDIQARLTEPTVMARVRSTLGALATAPVVLAVAATAAFGKDQMPSKVAGVLNFALTLEYLEAEFYATGVRKDGLIKSRYRDVFEQISKHETAHVALLKSALGSAAVKKPRFDFTAGGAFGDVFSNFDTFAAVAQAFEDTGVRAYKGQAGNLQSSPDILTIALQIHSVEARHAAAVRRIRGQTAWIVGSSGGDMPDATKAVYAGEGKTVQAGVELVGMMGLTAQDLSGAFDEPLSKDQVLAIVKPFIRG